ncbi:right-handed parallel beta-helix repeat-containing protein [Paenibacillus sp. SI8]|uniref:right-handed parallel beta-helix repeat-containing protein n=1 Tax=unclassified Paenibacillus TaxID=185978 RepID=UPI003467D8D1
MKFDDNHDNGYMTKLCEALSREVRVQTGEDFTIFLDKQDIKWGEPWHERITQSLDESYFLIPLITPLYFKRDVCREEFELFLEREKALGRHDLVLPIYYIQCDILESEQLRSEDPLAQEIAKRQYFNWRDLRFEALDSNLVRKKIFELASQICEAKKRIKATVSSGGNAHSQTKGTKVHLKAAEEGKGSLESTEQTLERKDVTIHIVDPLHRGNFSKIGDAVAAARPGDIIHVMPGFYNESIKLDKPLEIIGRGPRDEIVVQSSGESVLTFDSNFGRVSNLVLRQKSGDKVFCVTIRQGRLMLEDSDISSQVLSAIGVYNDADPRIRNNRIHSSKESGVYFYGDSTGTLEDNELSGNTLSGVAVSGGANPVIRRNKIWGNDVGISVYNGCKGRCEENEVSNNRIGLTVKKKANPIVLRNKFQQNDQAGVYVFDEGAGLLEGNTISHNGLSGIEVKNSTQTTCKDNEIHDNKQSGIYMNTDGAGTYVNNYIHHNGYSGISLKGATAPLFRHNRVSNNARQGIILNGGSGTFDNNEVVKNQGIGIQIQEEAEVTLTENEATGNMQGGVSISAGCEVKMTGNKVSDNTGYNLKSPSSIEGIMKNNQIAEL